MKYVCVFICCLISFAGAAQKKYEKESRITKAEFPENALKLLEDYTTKSKRLRFYKETDGNKTSFEAKFKFKGKKYSIEYNIKGILEDIEVEVKFKELSKDLRDNISLYFEQNYEKYTIKKVQKQFYYQKTSQAISVFEVAFKDGGSDLINYEIVAWRSTKKESGMVEFTFNKQGELINKRPFEQASYDHILY